jgi:dihydrofolate synthase/folylpolyglutamate synthase
VFSAGLSGDGCPCVISQQYPEVMELLLSVTEQRESESYAYLYDWTVSPDGENLFYESPNKSIILPSPSLKGDHQYLNAGNAITAALNLKQFNISEEHIAQGISKAFWPARLQKLRDGRIINQLPDNLEIWVDGAHNEAGAHVLSLWLKEQPIMPTYMIFGMTKGRDCRKFLTPFIGKIKYLAGVLIEAEPASYNENYVSEEAKALNIDASGYDSIEEALRFISSSEKNKARIIVCGSLYLAGDILYKNQRFISG